MEEGLPRRIGVGRNRQRTRPCDKHNNQQCIKQNATRFGADRTPRVTARLAFCHCGWISNSRSGAQACKDVNDIPTDGLMPLEWTIVTTIDEISLSFDLDHSFWGVSAAYVVLYLHTINQ